MVGVADRQYPRGAVWGNRVINGELRKHELSGSGGGTLIRCTVPGGTVYCCISGYADRRAATSGTTGRARSLPGEPADCG